MDFLLRPISFRAACDFIEKVHRHHKPPRGHKFSIAAEGLNGIAGVVSVGRPVSRVLDNGSIAEVTRLCTDGTPNLCSFLYGAAARTAEGMGYEKIITYILGSEPGTSLRAVGWTCEGAAGGGSWDTPSRRRGDHHPLEQKVRYARILRPRTAKIDLDDELEALLS